MNQLQLLDTFSEKLILFNFTGEVFLSFKDEEILTKLKIPSFKNQRILKYYIQKLQNEKKFTLLLPMTKKVFNEEDISSWEAKHVIHWFYNIYQKHELEFPKELEIFIQKLEIEGEDCLNLDLKFIFEIEKIDSRMTKVIISEFQKEKEKMKKYKEKVLSESFKKEKDLIKEKYVFIQKNFEYAFSEYVKEIEILESQLEENKDYEKLVEYKIVESKVEEIYENHN